MRNLIVSEFISLDGVMEGPGPDDPYKYAGWTFPYWCDEIGRFKQDELFTSDGLLLGRITYQGFASAWPTRTDETGFADRMNNLPKYVVSTSLKEASWKNTTIVPDHITEKVKELKQGMGQDILIAGSSQLVQSLLPAKLVDEFRLLVYPIILGSGKQLFSGVDKVALKLVETRNFPTGAILQRCITNS